MRPEIAAAYERMQAQRPEVRFQPLPEHGASAPDSHAQQSVVADDDGFEMGEGSRPDGDYELGASFSAAPPEERSRRGASAFTGESREESADSGEKPSNGTATDMKTGEKAESEKSKSQTRANPKKSTRGKADDVPHSEATAGDALLQVALQEERETGRHGRQTAIDPVRVADGWMISCPCPARARIKVKEAHRGKTGKCPNPNCGSYFTVPADLPMDEQTDESAKTGQGSQEDGPPADPAEKAGPYTHWIRDVRLHVVKPAKAKRKPGGHEKDFQPADLGFAKSEGVAAISLAGKASGFIAKPKKPEQVREEVTTELKAGTATAELSSNAVFTFAPDVLGKMIVEYPPAYEHESTFAGIPVFGAGFLAVKLPPAGAEDEQHFLALTLTQFRRLQELLEGLYEIDQLGFACPIPSDDDVVHLVCHYSENPLRVLRNPTFHLSDPEISLDIAGYRCESCGLIVSEDSRKKEKIGGLEGKKLASAKCPKCKGKFGKSPLYALQTAATENGEASDAADETSAQIPENAKDE